MVRILLLLSLLPLLIRCSSGRAAVSPYKKYAPEVLRSDYTIFRKTLEEAHPGIYWYTSIDSMNYYFDQGYAGLSDSLTEPQYRQLLSYIVAKINCGHTTVRPSKAYARFDDTTRLRQVFPLSLKLWNDTAVVAANLNRRDTVLVRGTVITAINEVPVNAITDSLFQYVSADGYNQTHKYQTLSNRGFFGSLYSSVYGYPTSYSINYLDSAKNSASITINGFVPPQPDTATRRTPRPINRLPVPTKKELVAQRRDAMRLLRVDTAGKIAMMDLQTFSKGYKLKKFFRRSFKTLNKYDIAHLIIDIRGNGGGNVSNSTAIVRYISNQPYKVADSLYAVAKRKTYGRYIENDFFTRLFISLFAGKKKDGLYHFRYFEKHQFKPKKKNHFDNKVYIVTGGNSFSAAALFAGALKGQSNVMIVGEETGGGAYGNSAWFIPDVTLPTTGVRFRLPLFRLVTDKNIPKNGKGVQPDVLAGPTIDAIREGKDYKIEKVIQLVKAGKKF